MNRFSIAIIHPVVVLTMLLRELVRIRFSNLMTRIHLSDVTNGQGRSFF